MYTFIFDTTGAGCNVILLKDETIMSSFSQRMDFGQSETLIPAIKSLLSSHNICFDDLNFLFVCTGPGSFTGVRSSISAARVFALAKPQIKVSGISAFEGYIQSLDMSEISETNAVIIETRREDFYVQIFDKNLQKLGEPKALSRQDIITKLKEGGKMVTLVGDGVERFLAQPSGLCLHAIKMCDTLPLNGLAKACLKAISSRRLNYPKPLYLRAPDVSVPKS